MHVQLLTSIGRYRSRTCDLSGVIRTLWPTELIARNNLLFRLLGVFGFFVGDMLVYGWDFVKVELVKNVNSYKLVSYD